MDKDERKRYLDHLSTNELFKASIEKATSEEERRKIKAFAEDVFLSIIKAAEVARKVCEENPEKMADVIANHISKK